MKKQKCNENSHPMSRKIADEEIEDTEDTEFDWNATHAKVKKAIPQLSKLYAEFESYGQKSVPITVMRDNGPEEYEFTLQEYKLLEDHVISLFSLLKTNRVKPRVGATQTLTPIYLGEELRNFFTDKKLIEEGAFDIVEHNKEGEEIKRWNPYKHNKGASLKPLTENGLIFAATAANLFRAYGANRNLISLATYNQAIHEKLSKKKVKEDEIEKKYNRAYVGLDDAAKKHLKPLITRMGKYYLNKPKKVPKKGVTKKGPAKQSVTPTETAKKQGFDPDQFQFNAMIQSFLKIGKLTTPDDKDVAFTAGKLDKAQMDRLTRIKTQKTKDDDYNALLAQDEATMTSEKIEIRRKKQEKADELARKKREGEEEDTEDDEEEDEEDEEKN
jgi:hypothetical protein